MRRIAIVGAGRLGARHLQGLGRLKMDVEFHVVEPSEEAVGIARLRLAEVAPGPNVAPLVVHSSVASLPRELDLVIVATRADVRLNTIETLLEHSKVGQLLLEKVLFQRPSDYERARRLLSATGTPSWVNCTRRIYPVYQELRDWFADDPLRHVDVWGGAWGLGSNGVHFVDLVAFLTGVIPDMIDGSGLDPELQPSTRAGCVEYSGALRGQAGGCSFSITSSSGGAIKHLVTLRAAGRTAIVDEEGGHCWRIAVGSSTLTPITIPFQSSLTDRVAVELLTTGSCALPRYEESMAIHLALLPALASRHNVDGACPVT